MGQRGALGDADAVVFAHERISCGKRATRRTRRPIEAVEEARQHARRLCGLCGGVDGHARLERE